MTLLPSCPAERPSVLYNEFDAHAAEWLSNLVAADLIPAGKVDTRSIKDLKPDDLHDHTHVHFFAGIGGWPYALRLAGWPDDRPVWTGSCPCQPFSSAGRGEGQDDPRHLWPDMFRLIRECRPHVVFGEQVASAIGHGWLDGVSADLEREGYAVGAAVLGAHSVGAPHIRQRLYWVAALPAGRECPSSRGLGDTFGPRLEGHSRHGHDGHQPRRIGAKQDGHAAASGGVGPHGMAYARHGTGRKPGDVLRSAGANESETPDQERDGRAAGHCGPHGGLADAEGEGGRPDNRAVRSGTPAGVRSPQGQDDRRAGEQAGRLCDCGPTGGLRHAPADGRGQERADGGGGVAGSGAEGGEQRPWSDFDVVACLDGKARRIEPGLEPLAHGVSGRVAVRRSGQPGNAENAQTHWYNRAGALKGFGNAIVPQLAAEFVAAFLDHLNATSVT